MDPVSGGWTSHKTRSDDYEMQKAAAIAQSKSNDFIQGVQQVYREGTGAPIHDSMSQSYGNVNIMPQDILQGINSNFAQVDMPGNVPRNDRKDIANSTGNVGLQTSSTKIPQQSPEEFETAALDDRLAKMATGGMNNLNNIPALYNRNV